MQQLSLFRGVHDTQPRPVTLEELVTMMRTDQSVRDLTEKHTHIDAHRLRSEIIDHHPRNMKR